VIDVGGAVGGRWGQIGAGTTIFTGGTTPGWGGGWGGPGWGGGWGGPGWGNSQPYGTEWPLAQTRQNEAIDREMFLRDQQMRRDHDRRMRELGMREQEMRRQEEYERKARGIIDSPTMTNPFVTNPDVPAPAPVQAPVFRRESAPVETITPNTGKAYIVEGTQMVRDAYALAAMGEKERAQQMLQEGEAKMRAGVGAAGSADPVLANSARDYLAKSEAFRKTKEGTQEANAANEQEQAALKNLFKTSGVVTQDAMQDHAAKAAEYAANYAANQGKLSDKELANLDHKAKFHAMQAYMASETLDFIPRDPKTRAAITLGQSVADGAKKEDIDKAFSSLAKTHTGGPTATLPTPQPTTEIENPAKLGEQKVSAKEYSDQAALKAFEAKVASLKGDKAGADKLANEAKNLSAAVSKMELSADDKANPSVAAALKMAEANGKDQKDVNAAFNKLAAVHANKENVDQIKDRAAAAQLLCAGYAVNHGKIDQAKLNGIADRAKDEAARATVAAELNGNYKGDDPAIEASRKLAYANRDYVTSQAGRKDPAKMNEAFKNMAEAGIQAEIERAEAEKQPSFTRTAGKYFLGAIGMVNPLAHTQAMGQRIGIMDEKTGISAIDDQTKGARWAQDALMSIGTGILNVSKEFFGLNSSTVRGPMMDHEALNKLRINTIKQIAQGQQQDNAYTA
jgi:hypothetical protein